MTKMDMLELNKMNNFPPLFPTSKYLNKKSWHKIIYFVSFIYSACCLYSYLLSFLILLDNLRLIKLDGNQMIMTLPMTLPLAPLMIFPSSTKQLNSALTYSFGKDPNIGLIILMFYFLVSAFLPSLIYTVMLSGLLGSKWRK